MILSYLQKSNQNNTDQYIQNNYNQIYKKLQQQNPAEIYHDHIQIKKNKNLSVHQSLNLQNFQSPFNSIKQLSNQQQNSMVFQEKQNNNDNNNKNKQKRTFSYISSQQNTFQNAQNKIQESNQNVNTKINNLLSNQSMEQNQTEKQSILKNKFMKNQENKENCYVENINSKDFSSSQNQKKNNSFLIQDHIQKVKESCQQQKSQTQLTLKAKFINQAGLKNGQQKVNQDSFICFQDNLFGVYDGHGNNGEIVSNFVSTNLNGIFEKLNQKYDIPNSMFQTYKIIQQNLEKSELSQISGSTALTVKVDLKEQKIFVTNVGDSRVILKLKSRVISLSQDHKPETAKEQERIQSLNGVIDYQYDQKGRAQGPLRVWTSQKEAGLAMTRSLGDQMVKQFGVCWQPEICVYNLTGQEEFMVLASDGLWEFINNQQCTNLVQPYYQNKDLDGAVDKLYSEARKLWLQNTNQNTVDDITIIVVFFKYQ